MDDKTLALLGDREAAERLTEAGVLIPCPGCKSDELTFGYYMTYQEEEVNSVRCKCGFSVRSNSMLGAIRAWNTRTPILTPAQLALLRIAEEPRRFEEEHHGQASDKV